MEDTWPLQSSVNQWVTFNLGHILCPENWRQDLDSIIKLAHVPVVTFQIDGIILRSSDMLLSDSCRFQGQLNSSMTT